MSRSAIIGFGRYLPKFRITSDDIARHWQQDPAVIRGGLGIIEKAVPDRNEDTFTMAFEASKQAIDRAEIRSTEISAVFVGSESHPYAVKPTSGMLVSALELDPFCHAADLEFACKAGTAGVQIIDAFVRCKQIRYGLAIGSDTAQGRPGDALEYSAAAGAAAFIIGSSTSKKALCRIEHTLSFTTDTPDFWRATDEAYPRHAGRFTGEPAYFKHVEQAFSAMLQVTGKKLSDIAHVVLHMPNAKFPTQMAKKLKISQEQMALGFIVPHIGNTYSACSPLGLTFVLEKAKKNEQILLVSYGSGSGADAFLLTMLQDGSPLPPDTRELERLNYSQYLSHSHALSHS